MSGSGAMPVPTTTSIAVTGAVTMTKVARGATGITTTGTVTGGTTIDASSARQVAGRVVRGALDAPSPSRTAGFPSRASHVTGPAWT